jgi:hypothetical protein
MSQSSQDTPAVNVAVTDNKAQLRYEAHIDGERVGLATYLLQGDQVAFNHVEVDPKWEGQGVGSALARGALDDTIARGKVITPQCPFVVDFVSRNPAYLPNVDAALREEIESKIAVEPEA